MRDPGTAPVRDGAPAGPFAWVVAAHGLSSLAFFAFYGVVFVQASYDHDAGPGQTAILGVALSIPFIFGSLLQGMVVDRWSPRWMATIGYADAPLSRWSSELRAGARIALRDRWLRLLLVVTGLGWAFVNTFFVLEPIFVREVLKQQQAASLFLWSAHGLGAVITAIVLATRARSSRREPAIICAGVALIGIGIFVYTAPATYALAFVGAVLQGVGFSLMYPPLLAFIQREVAADQCGRVTGVFVALQEAMGLLSSLVIVSVGTAVPVQGTLVIGGLALAALGGAGLRIARAASMGVLDGPSS